MTLPHSTPQWKSGILCLIVLLSTLLVSACSSNDSVYTGHFRAFGEQVDVTIVGVRKQDAKAAVDTLNKDLVYMEEAWMPHGRGALSRTNGLLGTGETFSAPPSILPLLEQAKTLENASGGLINPALGQVRSLWIFDGDAGKPFQPPDEDIINQLMALKPSLADVEVDGFRLRSANRSLQLDFGEFLKGYAIDQTIYRLLELGIDDAMVNIGGDLRAIGSRAGHPWTVPVRRPDGTGVLATLDIAGDESVMTVGTFQAFRDHKGVRYHHILDTRTGWPAKGTKAVTVAHRDATTAHAAATALFVAGPDAWPAIAVKMGVGKVMLIDEEGTLHITPELNQRLKFLGQAPRIQLQTLAKRAELR